MPDAVKSFIAGEVPAVALWVPFNVAVREALPDAVKLVDASAFYPQSAVLGGWAARMDYYTGNRDVLTRIIRGWIDANDHMVRNPAAAAEALQAHYKPSRPADITEAFKAQKTLFRARMAAALCRWHRRKMAAAGQRFLHDGCRRHRRAPRVGLFRYAALPGDGRIEVKRE